MKVALVIGTGERGGAEGQLATLAMQLRKAGVDAEVIFTDSGRPAGDDLDKAGVPWREFGFHGLSRSRYKGVLSKNTVKGLAGLVKMAGYLRTAEFDVVHAWLPQAVAITLTMPTLDSSTIRVAGVRGHIYRRG